MVEKPRFQEVNIALGDDVSRMLYEASKITWDNRPGSVVEMHPSFSGWRALRQDLKPADCYEGMGSDGIGTKVEIAERMSDHSTIAHDLFAMACDDAVVRGAEPIAINTVLDVNQLLDNDAVTETAIQQMAKGYIEAARQAGVVILNGETAELGKRIGSEYTDFPFNINWCATVLWYAQEDRVLTGSQIKPGDSLVGFPEHGFRSNGISDVRKAMHGEYGENWQNQVIPELGELSLGELVQKPSIIYSRTISELTGGFDINKEPKADITGVAHITGGGQPSKLGRMLEPSGLGAVIDNPITPLGIMKHIQQLCGFDDRKAYGKWHMGPGMIVATTEPEEVLSAIEGSQIIGQVTEEPVIRIKNMGVKQQEEWLDYPIAI